MTLGEVRIRDPFVLALPERQSYYLFGTTDKNAWNGPGTGFDCHHSRDLENWDGPVPAFRPPAGFWGRTQFWAPEVHAHAGRFYLFATFSTGKGYRGTQILVSDRPEGPYEPWSDGPVTPPHWQCLDGTLHVDAEGNPWIVFCHEWLQVHNGAMHAMRLSVDLRQAAGRPVLLFNATDAPWVRHLYAASDEIADDGRRAYQFPTYVTDGPFLYRTANGTLLMLWSSFGTEGYAMGLARAEAGNVWDQWIQEPEPLWAKNGGHGMIFRAFDGRLLLTLHTPNNAPHERAILRELLEEDDTLRLRPT